MKKFTYDLYIKPIIEAQKDLIATNAFNTLFNRELDDKDAARIFAFLNNYVGIDVFKYLTVLSREGFFCGISRGSLF